MLQMIKDELDKNLLSGSLLEAAITIKVIMINSQETELNALRR